MTTSNQPSKAPRRDNRGTGLQQARVRRVVQLAFLATWLLTLVVTLICMVVAGRSTNPDHGAWFLAPLVAHFVFLALMYLFDFTLKWTDGILSYHIFSRYSNYVPTATLRFASSIGALTLFALFVLGIRSGDHASSLGGSLAWYHHWPLLVLAVCNVTLSFVSYNSFDVSQSQEAWSPTNRMNVLLVAWGFYLGAYHTAALIVAVLLHSVEPAAFVSFLLLYWLMCVGLYYSVLDVFTYAWVSGPPDHPDLDAYGRIRKEIYEELGYIQPSTSPLERDSWDVRPDTQTLLAYNKATVIGGVRVLTPTLIGGELRLPIGRILDVETWVRPHLEPDDAASFASQLVEVSRLIVLPEFTGPMPHGIGSALFGRWFARRGIRPNPAITGGLFRALTEQLVRRGKRFVIATACDKRVIDLYTSIGGRILRDVESRPYAVEGYTLRGTWVPVFWDLKEPHTLDILRERFGFEPDVEEVP